MAYNARRGFLGAISVEGKISYHLFKIDVSNLTQNGNAVRLCRKSKWHTAWKFDEGGILHVKERVDLRMYFIREGHLWTRFRSSRRPFSDTYWAWRVYHFRNKH